MRQALDPSLYDSTLIDALIDARSRFGDKEILEDQDRHPLTYTGLIRAAFVLGRKIANMTDKGERVAILLPSSMGVVVTFFGLHAHGRVPVMLNFTAGEANLKAAIKASGVSSSNQVTALTDSKAAITQARSASLFNGRSGPLFKRRAEASVLSPTTSRSPKARA